MPRPQVRCAPPCSTVRTDHKGIDGEAKMTGWAAALMSDESPLAIMPGRGAQLEGLLNEVGEYLELAYAESTNKTDKYHLKAWKAACTELGTSMWRTDMAANSGVDPVGYRRELLVPALCFLKMYANMKPRSKKDQAANPRSCLLKLYAVAREHAKRGCMTFGRYTWQSPENTQERYTDFGRDTKNSARHLAAANLAQPLIADA